MDHCNNFNSVSCNMELEGFEFCTYEEHVCDGIANCPNGHDEAFEICDQKGIFSSLDTVECNKKDIFNLNITIKAVKCDGIYECANGEDETDCSLPDFITVVILIVIIIFSLLMSALMWIEITSGLQPASLDQSLTEEEFDQLHKTSDMKEKMGKIQSCTNAKVHNQTFIKLEILHHHGLFDETLCCIKNSLGPITTAKVLKDLPTKPNATSCWNTFSKVTNMLKNNSVIIMLKMVKTTISHIMDLIKDSIILYQVGNSQGGLSLLLAQPAPYIKGVSLKF